MHLLFEPWERMELMGWQIPLPQRIGYGHVYCLLDKDGEITKRDFVGLGEQNLEGEVKQDKGLKRLFNRFMRACRLQLVIEEDLICLADETEPVASFEISQEDYESALAYFKSLDGSMVEYDRTFNNCVHYANQDLKAAGIDLGNGLGLSAGAFFQKALKQSQGNLLAPPLGIEVVERTVPKHDPS
jgi:hypothetical protein